MTLRTAKILLLLSAIMLAPCAAPQTTGGVPSRLRINSLGVGVTPPAGSGNGHFTGNVQAASFNGDALSGVVHNGDTGVSLGQPFTLTASASDVNFYIGNTLASATNQRYSFRADNASNFYFCHVADSGTAWSITNCPLHFVRSGTTPVSTDIVTSTATNLTHNAFTVWDSNNDGAGSGLNADLLDGISSGGFCQTDGSGCPAAVSVAGSDTQVQFNDGGFFGADAEFVWNKTTNNLIPGVLAGQATVRAPDATSATAVGSTFNIRAGNGGATSGAGGVLNLTSGTAVGSASGSINITSGSTSTGTAGTVTLGGGSASGGGDGGNVTISGGAASSGNGLGGDVAIIGGGSAGAAEGGDINFTTGVSSGAGGQGDITLAAGTGTVDVTAADLTFNGSSLPVCSTGTFTGTLTGMTGSVTGTVTYRMCGTKVTLYQAGSSMSGTSNSVAMTMTGVPAAIQPIGSNQQDYLMKGISDNGVGALHGVASITGASGTITFSLCTVSGANVVCNSGFTNSGTKGLNLGWTISYERNTG